MTIAELIAQLEGVIDEHGNLEVVLSSDAEGNSFSPWANGFAIGVYEQGEFVDSESEDNDSSEPPTHIAIFPE